MPKTKKDNFASILKRIVDLEEEYYFLLKKMSAVVDELNRQTELKIKHSPKSKDLK